MGQTVRIFLWVDGGLAASGLRGKYSLEHVLPFALGTRCCLARDLMEMLCLIIVEVAHAAG